MEFTQALWVLRIIGGLTVGFLIARKFRDFIRSIVIMCIPLKHRISERSFQIQTRVTTLVAILLAIGIAVGLNFGLTKALSKMGITETINLSGTGMPTPLSFNKPQPRVTPITPPAPIEVVTEVPPATLPSIPQEEKRSTVYENPSPKVSKKPAPLPKITNYVLPERAYETPPNYSTKVNATADYQLSYYAQIYAFHSLEKAKQQQIRWSQHGQIPVKIGYSEGESTPYKVLIGPFHNRAITVHFLRSNGLKGFPKAAHELQVFQ